MRAFVNRIHRGQYNGISTTARSSGYLGQRADEASKDLSMFPEAPDGLGHVPWDPQQV